MRRVLGFTKHQRAKYLEMHSMGTSMKRRHTLQIIPMESQSSQRTYLPASIDYHMECLSLAEFCSTMRVRAVAQILCHAKSLWGLLQQSSVFREKHGTKRVSRS